MKKNPFFFIIDDGAFPYALPEKECPVGMKVYENILKIAKAFQVRIPICLTLKHLDSTGISKEADPVPYCDELVSFLKENQKYLEIGYHGLTHEYQQHVGEFFRLDTNQAVPEEVQREHIQLSQDIFESWGLNFPELFVPPYHAWEEGVTDRLLSELGVKYIVSMPILKVGAHHYTWKGSQHLAFYPRKSLGLSGSDCHFSMNDFRKIRFYPQKTVLEFVKDHIQPISLMSKLRIHHSLFPKPVHSFMTHIGNFFDESLDFWLKLFEYVEKNEELYLCRSNEDAMQFYNQIK